MCLGALELAGSGQLLGGSALPFRFLKQRGALLLRGSRTALHSWTGGYFCPVAFAPAPGRWAGGLAPELPVSSEQC